MLKLTLLALAALCVVGTAGPPPNIIMLLTDDLGWNSPGYHNPRIISPKLDELANGGLKIERHYTYRYCAPTRASFLTGRYPYHLVPTRANLIPPTLPDGVDIRYDMLPVHLKKAGYASHHVGKWHQGCHLHGMTPVGRGFDSSFGFLGGGEDHWTSAVGGNLCKGMKDKIVDLAFGNTTDLYTPAVGLNGTTGDVKHYTGTQFAKKAVDVIDTHAKQSPSDPLFLYFALHNTHAPIEAPQSFVDMYNFTNTRENNFNAQVSFVDQSVGNVTEALKRTGLWDNSLVIWTTDNGAPVQAAGSNYPLRGGKGSFWEGGYRTPTFVTGGILPDEMKGKTVDGLIHISDWFATSIALAGLPLTPSANAPTPIDGLNVWPYLSGKVQESPRKEIVLDHLMHCVPPGEPDACHTSSQTPDFPAGHYPNHTAGVLVMEQVDTNARHLYKLLVGPAQQASWYGVFTPNTTMKPSIAYVDCAPPDVCLFDLEADPTEHINIAKSNPSVLSMLMARFKELESTYHPAKANPPDDTAGYCKGVAANHGFVSPWSD